MKWFLILFMALTGSSAFATLKVAIIDTGAPRVMTQPCSEGHKDFTGTTLQDRHGHATNVSSIIDTYAAGADYCQIYLKFYDTKSSENSLSATTSAFAEAIRQKADMIVYAAGGVKSSIQESILIKEALDKGIIIVAAAGNESTDFDKAGCNYYPACYDSRILVVGCKLSSGKLCTQSNYGKGVDVYADGFQVNAGGYVFTGTSQATAIVAGKLIRFWQSKKEYRK